MLLLPSLLPLPLPLPLLIAAIDDIGENMLTATPISWFYGRTCLRHRQRHKGPGNSFGPFPGCPPLGLQCTNLSAPCTLLRPSESPRMSGRPPCWVPSGAGPAQPGLSSSEGTCSRPGEEGRSAPGRGVGAVPALSRFGPLAAAPRSSSSGFAGLQRHSERGVQKGCAVDGGAPALGAAKISGARY